MKGRFRRHMNVASIVDAVLEAPVVPSFTRIGYAARSRLDHWRPIDAYDLTGRTIVVTGATSGLGKHAAGRFAALGASVVVVGRNGDKTAQATNDIRNDLTNGTTNSTTNVAGTVTSAIADLGELDSVRSLAASLLGEHRRIDAIVHNAGALSAHRRVNSDGVEVTVASQVLGPFLLTSLLIPALGADGGAADDPGRVITVSSGGMYATGLTVRQLQMSEREYRGSEQYARAKRAQVTLNEMWAQRVPAARVVFHAMHPGWADTPGVAESLPTFRKIAGPLLRSVEEGADTMIWLAADAAPLAESGGFWHDRRRRSIHKLPSTRKADTPQRRADLWAWCVEQTGAITP